MFSSKGYMLFYQIQIVLAIYKLIKCILWEDEIYPLIVGITYTLLFLYIQTVSDPPAMEVTVSASPKYVGKSPYKVLPYFH